MWASLVCLILLPPITEGHSTYPGGGASCNGATGHGSVTAGNGGITIVPSKTTVYPGETISVSLSGTTYKGFLLKAASGSSWSSLPSSTQAWTCTGHSSVAHSDATAKNGLSFQWTAPSTTGSYQIEGFGVITYSAWHSLTAVTITVTGTAPTPTAAPTAAPTAPTAAPTSATAPTVALSCLTGCTDTTVNGGLTLPFENYATQTGGATGPNSLHEPGVTPVKHDPLILKATPASNGDTTLWVVVRGADGATGQNYLHPMSAAHYITHIYVKDQNGDRFEITLTRTPTLTPTLRLCR